MLAEQLAESFGAKLITWHIKSTTKAHQGLYEYDAVSRLRDSQLGVDKVHDVRNYIKKGKLWEAFEAQERVIPLIDEIDKADIEFPTTRCRNSTRWSSRPRDQRNHQGEAAPGSSSSPRTTGRNCPTPSCAAASSITSPSPDRETLQKIVDALPEHQAVAGQRGAGHLLRRAQGARPEKKPSTSELVDWLKLLMADEIGGSECCANATRPRRSAAGRRPGEERAGRAASRAPGVHEPPRQPLSASALSGERAAGGNARQRRNIPCSAEVACAAR